ncbi:hypothetical protein L596_015854 [Steinernema carpocapsae]|uniref:PCFS4-like zinc finger domain-containing protein n=1 Tax=Steinernema carpocapsae TaxID=34508 RepID=A0A4U5NGD0_STECR|nr:hypothetical protein L596_015854 [Steinernema carpocapsae]
MIDGESHRLRFGGPAREFYLNDFPFRGTFGGPAIYGRINGRRHEFRLSGPAPGVSVDPEPSYEFHQMLPSMQNMLTPPPNMATPLPKFEPKEEPAQTPPASDIFSFLRKLQKQGVLQATPPSESPKTASPPVEAVSPFNSGFGAPPENLFNNAQLLGVRYRSVVDSILKPTIVSCKECGLSYEDISEELRTRHRDDHVKEKLKRLKSATSGESRTWFPTKNKSFYECSIRAELLQSAHKKEQAKNGAPAATNTVVPSDSVEQKHCQACLEKFDEIYDDDEDVWMLKDSTLFQDKPYHTRCIDDA